ncbi:Biotin/lipoyl attachment protein [compost metagenome]
MVALLVEAGQYVQKNQPLLVLEAMKMEHVLKAECDGVIAALLCQQGDQVSQGTVLVHFADADTGPNTDAGENRQESAS